MTTDASLLRSETSGLGHVVDNRRSSTCRSTAGPSSPSRAWCLAWRCHRHPRLLSAHQRRRPRTNGYLFDGISVLQPEPGQVAFFPNVDAIQEFKIESNSPSAEFGRFNGGVVNLTTKSGSNAFQGTAFAFFRQRSVECPEFLCFDQPGQTTVSPQRVRWCRRRAHSTGSDVLLRRLSGAAADDRTNGDLHGTDAASAPRRIHRSHRRACAGNLRSGHDGG